MNKTLNDFFNAIDDGADKNQLLDIVEYMDDPKDLYNASTEVAGDHPDDIEIYDAIIRKLRRLEVNLGSRNGSRKGAESFATSGFNKAVNGITGTLKSKPVMNALKRTTGTEDQKNQMAIEDKTNSDAKKARSEQVRRNNLTDEQRQAEDNQKAAEKAFNDHQNREDVEKRTEEVFKQNGVEYPKKKGRKGTGPLCELDNISGKGSRPENLGQISSDIAYGRKRSIRLEGEYTTEESREGYRKGSRKGSTTVDGKSPMEYLNMLYDLQGFPSQLDVISHGSETDAEEYLRNNASFYGIEYEKYLRTIAEEYEG